MWKVYCLPLRAIYDIVFFLYLRSQFATLRLLDAVVRETAATDVVLDTNAVV